MKKYIISKKEYDEVVEAMNTLTSENQKLRGFIEGMREQLILSGVSQQREQLIDFLVKIENTEGVKIPLTAALSAVDEYIKGNL